jgi:hypothetical protein
MEQAHTERVELLNEHITASMVEALTEKVVQAKEKREELVGKFHNLEKVVQGSHIT